MLFGPARIPTALGGLQHGVHMPGTGFAAHAVAARAAETWITDCMLIPAGGLSDERRQQLLELTGVQGRISIVIDDENPAPRTFGYRDIRGIESDIGPLTDHDGTGDANPEFVGFNLETWANISNIPPIADGSKPTIAEASQEHLG
jgi:hypothetical protein